MSYYYDDDEAALKALPDVERKEMLRQYEEQRNEHRSQGGVWDGLAN